jgi:hypothetical protein
MTAVTAERIGTNDVPGRDCSAGRSVPARPKNQKIVEIMRTLSSIELPRAAG